MALNFSSRCRRLLPLAAAAAAAAQRIPLHPSRRALRRAWRPSSPPNKHQRATPGSCWCGTAAAGRRPTWRQPRPAAVRCLRRGTWAPPAWPSAAWPTTKPQRRCVGHLRGGGRQPVGLGAAVRAAEPAPAPRRHRPPPASLECCADTGGGRAPGGGRARRRRCAPRAGQLRHHPARHRRPSGRQSRRAGRAAAEHACVWWVGGRVVQGTGCVSRCGCARLANLPGRALTLCVCRFVCRTPRCCSGRLSGGRACRAGGGTGAAGAPAAGVCGWAAEGQRGGAGLALAGRQEPPMLSSPSTRMLHALISRHPTPCLQAEVCGTLARTPLLLRLSSWWATFGL